MNAIFVSICQSEYRFVLEMKGHVHEIHDVEKEKKSNFDTCVFGQLLQWLS